MTKQIGAAQKATKSGDDAKPYQPECGHFVWLNFTPHAGHEQAQRRPALVLSPMGFNIATGLAFVCPVTNQGKASPFEVVVPKGARITGYVLSDQMRSLDWVAREAAFHSHAPNELVLEVLARIEAILQVSFDP
jgi:mRNA interferase MazF